MWQDYLTEFSGILPRVVARLDPETPYWPSSPSADYEALSRPVIKAAMRTSGMSGTDASRSRLTKRIMRASSPSMDSSRFRR